MNQKAEVNKIVVLSTAHVAETLATGAYPPINRLSAMVGDHGWLVWTGTEDATIDAVLKEVATESVRQNFKEILFWATKKGAKYVLFDSDGPTHEKFPVYSWEPEER